LDVVGASTITSLPLQAGTKRSVARGMTSQGTRYGASHNAFRRALETRSVTQPELAMREMRRVPLLDALDYVALLAVERSERLERRQSGRWASCFRNADGSRSPTCS
jgi:hypothetical protein